MARVKQIEPSDQEEVDLITRAKKYAFLKSQMDFVEKELKELRVELFADIDDKGEPDDKGNIVLPLPQEVDGYVAAIKQRRVSRKINEAKAEEIIESKNLGDKLYKMVRVIDEDALMAALYSDELSEAEVDEMYPQSIVWALVLSKK